MLFADTTTLITFALTIKSEASSEAVTRAALSPPLLRRIANTIGALLISAEPAEARKDATLGSLVGQFLLTLVTLDAAVNALAGTVAAPAAPGSDASQAQAQVELGLRA